MKRVLKIFTAADIGLIVILLLIAMALLWQIKTTFLNKKIEIHHHNELVGTYDLQEDQLIELGKEAVVEIAGKKVRIKDSTCKKQYCVQQGWSERLPIICVPNEIVINFISKKEEMLITR